MQIKDILKIIKKRLVILIVIPVFLTVVTALTCILFITPQYEANLRVYVISPMQSQTKYSYDDLMVDQYFVHDYQELIKSRAVLEAAIQKMGLEDHRYETLAARIKVESVKNTRILKITVQDPQPELTRDIANTVAATFIEQARQLMHIDNITVIDSARTPRSPVSPKTLQFTGLAFLLGCLVGFTSILLLDYLDDTLKTQEDVEKYLGLKVIGSIPDRKIKNQREDQFYGNIE